MIEEQEIMKLALGLIEARAEIAELKERVHYAEGTAAAQIADRQELEAQIAAKDAALREARSVIDTVIGQNKPALGWAYEVRETIDAALAKEEK